MKDQLVVSVRNASLRRKMAFAMVAVALAGTIATGTIAFFGTRQVLRRQAVNYSMDTHSYVRSIIAGFLSNLEQVSYEVLANGTIQTLLTEIADASHRDHGDATPETFRFRIPIESALVRTLLTRDSIDGIHVLTVSGEVFGTAGWVPNQDIWNTVLSGDGSMTWIPVPELELFVAGRAIKNLDNMTTVGAVVLVVDIEELRSILLSTSVAEHGTLEIAVGSSVLATAGRQTEAFENDSGMRVVETKSRIHGNGWYLVTRIPKSFFSEGSAVITLVIVAAGVMVAAGAAAAALFLASLLSAPIEQLTASVGEINEITPVLPVSYPFNDEIGKLYQGINQLLSRSHALVERVYRAELGRTTAELDMLRAQVNPHFLYNVLDTINWLARSEGADRAANIVNGLGRILRHSIEGGQFAPVWAEVRMLRDYIQIQTARYGASVTVDIRVDDGLEQCQIPKLTLQPLVENIYQHAGGGRLEPVSAEVAISSVPGGLRVRITDDGIGMSESLLRSVREDSGIAVNHHSIGIRSVDRRLFHLYGRSLTLVAVEKGTCLEWIVPQEPR